MKRQNYGEQGDPHLEAMIEPGYILDLDRMPYREAWALQQRLHERRRRGAIGDGLLLVEHPPTYTIGRSVGAGRLAAEEGRLRAAGFDVVRTDRGGDITFHGPGQLVGYPIVDLRRHGRDVHRYLRDLEEVLIRAVAGYGIRAERSDGLTGVWAGGAKLASIGVRVVRWVTMHGFALNRDNDLSPFARIVPCGIAGCRMTSVAALTGGPVDRDDLARRVVDAFAAVFRTQLRPVASRQCFDSPFDEAPRARAAAHP